MTEDDENEVVANVLIGEGLDVPSALAAVSDPGGSGQPTDTPARRSASKPA